MLVLLAWTLAAGSVRADIYGYIDERGVAHFTNVPEDRRYKLIMRTPDGPAEPRSRAGSGAAGKRLAAKGPSLAQRRAYQSQIADVALAMSLDVALVHAVIATESGYNPKARSGRGAMGLMQLMPETARRYCVRNPYDPAENLRAGSQYLRDLLVRYKNDLTLALAAYNAGEQAVAKHGNRLPPYPETQAYVPKVMGLYERFRNSQEFKAAADWQKPQPPSLLPATAKSCETVL